MHRFVWIRLMGGILVLQAGAAYGQSMVEVSAAAAGGSAAGVAGKKVSDGVDTIFGKISKQTNAAAQTKPPAERATAPVDPAVPPGPAEPGAAASPSVLRGARVVTAKPAKEPELQPAATSAPAPEPEAPPLTAAQLSGVQNGASRADVLAKIGKPYARITIPEDSHLVEIYQYAAKGQLLGSVRFTDGVVSTVRVDAK